jgi:hypothetical protein
MSLQLPVIRVRVRTDSSSLAAAVLCCALTYCISGVVAGGDRPGRRVCDIKLQAQTLCEGFELAQAADTGRAVIRVFTNTPVAGKLLLELVPKTESPGEAEAPLLNFVEIVCSRR